MRRSFLITALMLFVLLAVLSPALAQSKLADWTYMQYYNADNNLETSLYGDLTEMQEVGSTDQVNILAQVDRAPGYETGFGDWTDTRRFRLVHEPQPVLSHEQKLDEIVAYAYAQSGQDYHTLIASAAQLRQSDPTTYTKKLTDIGVDPSNDTQIDEIIHNHEIGLEFNTQAVQDMGELDMGDPQTLVDFVTWAVQNYPAKHYALTISTHGAGWLGNGPDETNNNDELTLPDLTSALKQIQQKTGLDQLDIIGFDACLMGQLEVYRALVPYARYVLASEEEIPGDGWEYATPFQELTQDPTMDAKTFGTDIVDAYMKYYAGPGHRTQVDLGLIDESKIQSVVDALKTFTDSADQDTLDRLSELGVARLDAQRFATATSDDIVSETSADLFSSIDLISFMKLIAGQPDIDDDLKTAANNVITAAQAAIIYSAADSALPDAHGMAIYFPTNSKTAQLPTVGAFDPVPYTTANPNMSAWNTFLNTFHQTIDTALKPGNVKLNMDKVLPESGTASIYDPPVLIFDTHGLGIATLQFYAVLNKPDGTSELMDTSPLSFETYLTDGTLIDEMPNGDSLGDDFAWTVQTTHVTDGSQQIQTVLFTPDPGTDQRVITGTYVSRQTGKKTTANLIFSSDTQQLLATYGTDDNGQVSEVETSQGDQFYPDQYAWTDNGPTPSPASDALTYGIQPFSYSFVPAPSGDYGLGMQMTDMAGNSVFGSMHVTVNNDGLDLNWRGFKDIEHGLNFLYPWSWPDPSTLDDQNGQPDELEVNDPNGDIRIYVAKRDEDIDAAAQDMQTLESGQTDAQVNPPSAFNGDMKKAQWFTYTYTDSGVARDGVVIIMRVDSNDATYTFDVDSPHSEVSEAQQVLNKMVKSLTFFTPYVPPDSTETPSS